MSYAKRDSLVCWHPFTQMKTSGLAIPIVSARGALLYDEDGNAFIDAISSWWVNIHGHANEAISRGIEEQLDKLHQVIFAGFTHPCAVELAEKLLRILPANIARIFYSDDGSTAVEVALKMALQYWFNRGEPRKVIVALEGAYHGDTFGAMSAGERGGYTTPFSEHLFSVVRVPRPGDLGFEATLANILKQGEVAAFIYEPLLQGASGMKTYSAEALKVALDMCGEYGVLKIADEVLTGFFRTGRIFASDYVETKPDIMCLSKGLTGGSLPLGVTAASAAVYDAFLSDERAKMFLHSHSFTANSISCAAAISSINLLLQPECQANVARILNKHAEFSSVLRAHPKARNVRSLGTLLAFEVSSSAPDGYFHELRDRLYDFFINNRVLLRPLGNTVYVLPPYCITDEELERVYSVILSALDEVVSD